MPVEFDCEDCSARVFQAALHCPPTPPLCSTCAFVRKLSPAERRKFKECMASIEQLRMVRQAARKAGLHA
jgi:hypothetical protein